MERSKRSRSIAVLLVAAICLVVGAGSLEAGNSKSAGGGTWLDSGALGAFVAGLLWSVTGIWDLAGAGMDPNGISDKAGAGMDPNGIRDSAGAGMDPNGISDKAGAGMDPNG